jgi:hypothetical protein
MRALTFLAVLLGLLGAAGAEEGWESECRAMLDQAGEVLAGERLTLVHWQCGDLLPHGGRRLLRMTLEQGREYAVVGVCSETCRDLDLRLETLDGEEVDGDVELDDYPIVRAEGEGSGDLRLEVLMADCLAERCAYGIGVYAR